MARSPFHRASSAIGLLLLLEAALPVFAARASARSGQLNVWMMPADGSNAMKFGDYFPAWSLDGRRIAWMKGGRGRTLKICRDPDGSEPAWLTAPRGIAGFGEDAAVEPGDLQVREHTPWSRQGGGAASIAYTLPKAGHVRVRVFDAAGREVARPVDEWQPAGAHTALFAFGPDTNQVFVYRVECDGRRASGKIELGP